MSSPPRPLISGTPLPPEEAEEVFAKAAAGDLTARERIIMAYIPLVNRNCSFYEGKGVPYDDLFQEGCYGLMVALDCYDPDCGKSFSEHAATYIRKHLQKTQIAQNSLYPIVYKEDFFYEMQKYSQALDELKEKLNREPTNRELAQALKTTENKIRKLSQSLYSFIPQEENAIYFGTPASENPETASVNKYLDLSCLNVKLSKNEYDVLSRRMGFTASGIPETASEAAAALGITYETARANYNSAINKLKNAVMEKGYTITTINI